MQIPILNGIYTDNDSDFRTSYPRNLIPVPKQSGISNGYLRPSDGIIEFSMGPGVDRGGINWDKGQTNYDGIYYRVMGTKLIKIFQDGSYKELGDVGGTDQIRFAYSFDYLAIVSDKKLYYWDDSTLQQVTDTDLGEVISMIWIDGYFMTTDGESLVVTDLSDPFNVNPLKYGSSEADPDRVNCLLKLRNEAYALNRHTVEVFNSDLGLSTSGFPFQRIEGAQIEKGTYGPHSACVFMERIAFVGSGINEAPAIYMGFNGDTLKISTREIDQILLEYTEQELADVVCEARVDKGHEHLWVRLKDQTLVYDGPGSRVLGEPVWFTLTTSLVGKGKYRAQNLVYVYDKWQVGDPLSSRYGYLDDRISSHYGQENGWDFGTQIIYNEGRGAIFHELELVCLTGRVELDKNPVIWTQYSLDGQEFSVEFPINTGTQGSRNDRITWLKQGPMRHWRLQRFRGTSDSHLSMSRLQARIEPLNV